MPDLSFEQDINQSLQMLLSPRLLQMLKILNLPYVELISEIEKASEENPFLEIERHDTLMEYLKYLREDKKARKEIDSKEYPGLENIKDGKQDLRSFLLGQLNLIEISGKKKKAAELLIDEIDGHGYLKNYEEIKQRLVGEKKVSPSEIDGALLTIQTFEPDGVGARDVKECLLIQVREYGFDNIELQETIEEAIKNHLEDLSNNNFAKAANDLGITTDGVSEILNFIKQNLSPYPAASFGEGAQDVVPSFVFEYDSSKNLNLVNLEEKYGPKIALSADYRKMLNNPKTDAETVKFLKERFEKAKEMLENLNKRGETSVAIMNIVLEVQKDYIEKGPERLEPLEQKEIASRLGLHPSTISRAVANKYVQTPRGLLPVKSLCPRSYRGFTSVQIKSRMKEIVLGEKTPLSDSEIADLMLKEGIVVGRRTLASYRKELGILSKEERIKK